MPVYILIRYLRQINNWVCKFNKCIFWVSFPFFPPILLNYLLAYNIHLIVLTPNIRPPPPTSPLQLICAKKTKPKVKRMDKLPPI